MKIPDFVRLGSAPLFPKDLRMGPEGVPVEPLFSGKGLVRTLLTGYFLGWSDCSFLSPALERLALAALDAMSC